MKMEKSDFLNDSVKHIDIKSFDSTKIIEAMKDACSSSTLKEAHSWGKVNTLYEQMFYAEATSVLPLIISYVYHRRSWEDRYQRKLTKIFK